jgi:ParB-like chromosome segregation protein Spo0J
MEVRKIFKVADLQIRYMVRTQADAANVAALKRRYQNGLEVDPPTVDPEGYIFKGHHRRLALIELGREEIECIVQQYDSFEEYSIEALADNSRSTLRSTSEDINFTIRTLLEKGTHAKRIIDLIIQKMGYPDEAVNEWVRRVKVQMADTAMNRALADVAHERLTATGAAQKYGVPLAKLQSKIQSQGRQKKKEPPSVEALLAKLSNHHRSVNAHSMRLLNKAVDLYDLGEYSDETADRFIASVEKSLKSMSAKVSDVKVRLEARKATARSPSVLATVAEMEAEYPLGESETLMSDNVVPPPVQKTEVKKVGSETKKASGRPAPLLR